MGGHGVWGHIYPYSFFLFASPHFLWTYQFDSGTQCYNLSKFQYYGILSEKINIYYQKKLKHLAVTFQFLIITFIHPPTSMKILVPPLHIRVGLKSHGVTSYHNPFHPSWSSHLKLSMKWHYIIYQSCVSFVSISETCSSRDYCFVGKRTSKFVDF